jgi:hypothetical protein
MNYTDTLIEIFVACDDFYKEFDQFLAGKGLQDPLKKSEAKKLYETALKSDGSLKEAKEGLDRVSK